MLRRPLLMTQYSLTEKNRLQTQDASTSWRETGNLSGMSLPFSPANSNMPDARGPARRPGACTCHGPDAAPHSACRMALYRQDRSCRICRNHPVCIQLQWAVSGKGSRISPWSLIILGASAGPDLVQYGRRPVSTSGSLPHGRRQWPRQLAPPRTDGLLPVFPRSGPEGRDFADDRCLLIDGTMPVTHMLRKQ